MFGARHSWWRPCKLSVPPDYSRTWLREDLEKPLQGERWEQGASREPLVWFLERFWLIAVALSGAVVLLVTVYAGCGGEELGGPF